MKKNMITAAVLAVMLLLPAGAEESKKDAVPKKDKSPVLTREMNQRLKSPITLKAQNSPLSEILQILAERSGLNFVTGSGVKKAEITIILNKTPLDEAINLVVRAAGLSYEIIGNSILIAEPGKLKDEVGQSGYVVALKYADAAEVAGMLGDLTKNIKIDRGGNRLILYTSPRVIIEVERIVRSIDHPHTQILLETRILEIAEEDLNRYGIDWSTLFPVSGGIYHPEVGLKEGYSLGGWNLLQMNLGVDLDMLFQDGDSRILMDSKLTTMNNREAKLHIGDIVPYTVQSYNMSASGGINLEIQKEEVGVKLSMTPHINDEGDITLTLEPEVSSITGWKGQYSDVPLVRVRKANTTIRVKDGQLVTLAGLLSEESLEEVKRFPLLGYIPYLGRLFQHRREEIKKTNLVIEVRPRIVTDWADAETGPDSGTPDGKTE